MQVLELEMTRVASLRLICGAGRTPEPRVWAGMAMGTAPQPSGCFSGPPMIGVEADINI